MAWCLTRVSGALYTAAGPAVRRLLRGRPECVTMFTPELPWLSERDKELIMGRALCTWLDWPLPA